MIIHGPKVPTTMWMLELFSSAISHMRRHSLIFSESLMEIPHQYKHNTSLSQGASGRTAKALP